MTTAQALPSAVRATLTLIGDYERAAEKSREMAAGVELALRTYSYEDEDYADRKLRIEQHRRSAVEFQAEADRLRTYLPKG